MNVNKIAVASGLGLIVAGAALGGCSFFTHHSAPSPTNQPANLPRSQEIQEPHGFRNVIFGCFGPNGVYVTSANADDSLPSSVFVLANDPQCR